MACAVCGSFEKSDTHALLECPFAECVGESIGVGHKYCGGKFRCLRDCAVFAACSMSSDELGNFVATLCVEFQEYTTTRGG